MEEINYTEIDFSKDEQIKGIDNALFTSPYRYSVNAAKQNKSPTIFSHSII